MTDTGFWVCGDRVSIERWISRKVDRVIDRDRLDRVREGGKEREVRESTVVVSDKAKTK